MIAIFLIIFVGSLWAFILVIIRYMKNDSKGKFSRLEESTAIDQEADPEFDSVIGLKDESKLQEVKIELAERIGRSKKKEKREKSHKKSKDKIGSSSREASEEQKKALSKEKKNKERRKSSSEQGVVKRKDKSKEKKERSKERSQGKNSRKKKE